MLVNYLSAIVPIRKSLRFLICCIKDIIFSLNLFQRQVIAGGKTMVLIKSDNPDIREIFLKVVHRTVNRSIICHDDSSMVSAVFDNVGKKLLKEFLPVPVQYDDGCFQ